MFAWATDLPKCSCLMVVRFSLHGRLLSTYILYLVKWVKMATIADAEPAISGQRGWSSLHGRLRQQVGPIA